MAGTQAAPEDGRYRLRESLFQKLLEAHRGRVPALTLRRQHRCAPGVAAAARPLVTAGARARCWQPRSIYGLAPPPDAAAPVPELFVDAPVATPPTDDTQKSPTALDAADAAAESAEAAEPPPPPPQTLAEAFRLAEAAAEGDARLALGIAAAALLDGDEAAWVGHLHGEEAVVTGRGPHMVRSCNSPV